MPRFIEFSDQLSKMKTAHIPQIRSYEAEAIKLLEIYLQRILIKRSIKVFLYYASCVVFFLDVILKKLRGTFPQAYDKRYVN